MELRRLRYFIAVAEVLNFRRAAENLHVAQSPLSQQIRKLEGELGVLLLTRDRKRVALTAAGHRFLSEARAVIARAGLAAARTREAASGHAGALSLGYLTSMTNSRFSDLMTAFRQECPEVELTMNDLVPDEILAAVREGRVDVGLLRAPFRDEQLASREIWRERFVVALPAGHWLAPRGIVAMRSLAEERFIMVPDQGSMGLNDAIRTLCLKAGFSPKRHFQVNQMQAAVWLVQMGFGIAVVPASLSGLHRDNVVYQPIESSPVLGAYLIWRKSNDSPVLAKFLETARPIKRQPEGSPRTRAAPR